MKSKTAVEWLENEFKEAHKMFGGIDTNWIKRFEHAKEIEKEQIVKASAIAFEDMFGSDGNKYGEDYYNETFKSE